MESLLDFVHFWIALAKFVIANPRRLDPLVTMIVRLRIVKTRGNQAKP
jgi:hypothetical protein